MPQSIGSIIAATLQDNQTGTIARGDKGDLVNIVILFTARSGSSWLIDVLNRTKELGIFEEYFNPDFVPQIAGLVKATDEFSYLHGIQDTERSQTNVFGIKCTASHLKLFEQIDPIEFFLENGRRSLFVILRRKDVLRQAVSIYLAVKTGLFHSVTGRTDASVPVALEVEPQTILENVRHLVWEETALEVIVAGKQIEPVRLFYEDIAGNEQSALDVFYPRVLGRRAPRITPSSSHLKIDRGGVGDEIVTRIRNECRTELAALDQLRPPYDPAKSMAGPVDPRRLHEPLASVLESSRYFQFLCLFGRGFVFFTNEAVFSGSYRLMTATGSLELDVTHMSFAKIGVDNYTCALPLDVPFDPDWRSLQVRFAERTYRAALPDIRGIVAHIDQVRGNVVQGWISIPGQNKSERAIRLMVDDVEAEVAGRSVYLPWGSTISNSGGLDGFEWTLPVPDPRRIDVHDAAGNVVCRWRSADPGPDPTPGHGASASESI